MSEQDNSHFGLWLWLITAWIMIALLTLHVEKRLSERRDLQRRVAVLE